MPAHRDEARLTYGSRAGAPLSARQRQVLELRARGRTVVDIAAELYVTARTVETHLDHIAEKLNTRNPALLALWAVRLGLVDPADVEQLCQAAR